MNIDQSLQHLKELIDLFYTNKDWTILVEEVLPVVINHRTPENLSFTFKEDEDLFIQELKDYYLDILTSTDIHNLIEDRFITEFLQYYVPKEYINHPMYEQSISKFIENQEVELEAKEHEETLLGKDRSITKILDLEYPYDTCPMIDADKEIIEEKINELNQRLEDLEDEEDEETHDSIQEDLEIEHDNLKKAEELREACSDMRSLIQKFTQLFKDDTKIYQIDDAKVIQFPNFTTNYYEERTTLLNSNHLRTFNDGLMDDSIENLDKLVELMNSLIEKYNSQEIQNEILKDFNLKEIEDFKRELKEEFLKMNKFKIF